ncbi:MAG: hypothetical protein OXJ52_03890 [Oligoflexia bacterium]|nr:hypothetical protein [Oligoflexia bacterium]
MKKLKKKIFIAILSFFNLAVLGLVFNSYFSSQEQIHLFSVSESLEDLKGKIQRECEKELKAILNGERNSFICSVSLQKKHKGVSYSLKTRFKVSKEEDKIKIKEISGKLRDTKQHITEARFCGDCAEDKELEDSATQDITELMKEVLTVAEDIYDQAQDSVEKAYEEYNQKDKEKRLVQIKERNCEGAWNEEAESFEEFTETEDKLKCRLNQISNLNSPLEAESFYHSKLKKELWHLALSEDKYLLEDGLLDQFKDPYRNSLSVRSSAGLLESYLRWKEDFDILESLEEKQNFLRAISSDVNSMTGFMTEKQARQDIYYLNKGLDGLSAQLNQQATNLPQTPTQIPPAPSINYEAVSKEVDKLY